MKTLLIIIALSISVFAQSNPDSLKQVEIQNKFMSIQKAYRSTDSLQIKRIGQMEMLQQDWQAIGQKKKKK